MRLLAMQSTDRYNYARFLILLTEGFGAIIVEGRVS
jgi:hypothetical protein